MSFQQVLCLPEITGLQSCLRKVHVPRVGMATQFGGALFGPPPLRHHTGKPEQENQAQTCRETGHRWLAPTPTPGLFRAARRMRHNRLPIEESTQLRGQGLRGRIPFGWLLFQALERDCFQVSWNRRIEQAR